eukprot:sb/3467204/
MPRVSPHSSVDNSQYEQQLEIRKKRKILVFERRPSDHNGWTIFFYHGAGATYRHFDAQIEHVVTLGYRAVTCDMYGHGSGSAAVSERGKHMFTFEQFCYDALTLFDRYAENEMNVLVGHSYGTSLCTLVYNERRSRVRKLVLLSGGGPYALAPEKYSLFSLPSSILSCLKPIIVKLFREACFHSPRKKSWLSDRELLSIEMDSLRHVMRGQYWEEGDENYHAHISCPVLLVVGRQDRFITLSDEISMNMIVPRSVLHILEAGHLLPIECSDEVNDLLGTFLTYDLPTHCSLHQKTLYKKVTETVV